MRKRIAAATFAFAIALGGFGATSAFADPSFGPGAGNGSGNNEPQDQGAKCHPPGQTTTEPGCK
jgi:hypothetical protein